MRREDVAHALCVRMKCMSIVRKAEGTCVVRKFKSACAHNGGRELRVCCGEKEAES